MNIQDAIGYGFGHQERAWSTGVNAYFGIREQTDHTQLLTMDLYNQGMKFIILDRHLCPWKTGSYTKKFGKISSRGNVFFKIFWFQLYGVFWLWHMWQVNMKIRWRKQNYK